MNPDPPVSASQMLGLQVRHHAWLFFLFYFIFCGTEDGTQGHSTSELHLQPIFIFYLKQGLSKLLRASLSS